MKKVTKIIRISLILSFFIISGYALQKSYTFLFMPRGYTLTTDIILAKTTKNQIDTFIAQKINYKEENLNSIAKALHNRFLYIKSVNISRLATQALDINIHTYNPLFIVNDNHILLESGMCEPKNTFDANSIASLERITIHASAIIDNHVDSTCYRCLTTLSPHIIKMYNLIWISACEIWLKNKKQQRFALLCNTNTIHDGHKITLGTSLKNEIVSKKAFNYNTMKTWVADIRFDNQIVIFSRGGRGYGYTTSS